MDYSTLKNKIMQDKLSIIINKNDVFFAFSQDQLDEGLKKIKNKKENLTSIGAGGFMPKKNVKTYIKDTASLYKWFEAEVKKLNPNKVIRYELNNYECYYSGDITRAYEVLKDYDFTREDVNHVFHNRNYKLNK